MANTFRAGMKKNRKFLVRFQNIFIYIHIFNFIFSPFMVMIFDTQEELSRFLQVKKIYASCCQFISLQKIDIFFFQFFSRAVILPMEHSVKCTEALGAIIHPITAT